MKITAWIALAALGAASLLAGCSSSGASTPSHPEYYVSIGDSYAAGYQPTGHGVGHTDRNGFAYQVPGLAKARGYDLTLENFGCGGATAESVVNSVGCPKALLGPGATPYPSQTQAQAAEAFIRDHPGRIGLITVSIGGNDIDTCAAKPAAQVASCVQDGINRINANLPTLLSGLRAAAGPGVPIVGLTYPDVILGLYLASSPPSPLVGLSVSVFKGVFNPVLKQHYLAVGGTFLDVTAALGSYTPLSQTTTLAGHGTVPVAVADVCNLTYFCQYGDIHPKTPGYTMIAKLIADSLPKH